MDHLEVDRNIRLEALDNSIAEVVFLTIQQEREYLSNWLPFVNSTQKLADTEAFIHSITNQKTKKNGAKIFVLDTNVLLHDPQCLHKFEDSNLLKGTKYSALVFVIYVLF